MIATRDVSADKLCERREHAERDDVEQRRHADVDPGAPARDRRACGPESGAKLVSTSAPSESVATRMLNGGICSSAIRMVTQVVPQPMQSTTRSSRALALPKDCDGNVETSGPRSVACGRAAGGAVLARRWRIAMAAGAGLPPRMRGAAAGERLSAPCWLRKLWRSRWRCSRCGATAGRSRSRGRSPRPAPATLPGSD